MYLLLGNLQDPCCQDVRLELERRHLPVQTIPNPFSPPWRFTWRLDNQQSLSQLSEDGQPPLPADAILGVLVRHPGWVDPAGWQPDDLAYMRTEMSAALIAWLWSLPCPVVNRFPPAVWYLPRAPFLSWVGLLQRCSLPVPEIWLTNVELEAQEFRLRLETAGAGGGVYGPLTSERRFLLAADGDWSGLASLQRHALVSLQYPHADARLACVLGEQVVWDGTPSEDLASLEPALCSFAAQAGLSFVEVAFAPVAAQMCAVDVEPNPHFERFGEAARAEIVAGLVRLLTQAHAEDSSPGGDYTPGGNVIPAEEPGRGSVPPRRGVP